MTVHLDTSVLIGALGDRAGARTLVGKPIEEGHRLAISTLVLFEWLRGPREEDERALRAELFPDSHVVVFGVGEAARAAVIYKALARARQREIDIAIAACAIEHEAALWTLNPQDFKDIPDLRLYK